MLDEITTFFFCQKIENFWKNHEGEQKQNQKTNKKLNLKKRNSLTGTPTGQICENFNFLI